MKPATGTPFFVPDSEEHLLSNHKGSGRRFFDDYQHNLIDRALKHITRREFALDIGAHIGLLAMKMAKHFKQVWAFEPNQESYGVLTLNLSIAKAANVFTYPFALGEKRQEVGLQQGKPGNTGDCQVNPTSSGVLMNAVDDLLVRPNGHQVDFVKLDVQGYELKVLQGAEQMLRRDKPVCLVEQEPEGKLRMSFSPEYAAVKFLKHLGAMQMDRVGDNWIMGWPK